MGGVREAAGKKTAAASPSPEMTLLLLIATAWLVIAAFFVALCRLAGRSDAALLEVSEATREHTFLPALLVWRDAPELAARDLRPAAQPAVRGQRGVATRA
jgi:hypothetical protein